MRQSLGTAVVFGMLGVTVFGLIFTPVFYVVSRSFSRKRHYRRLRASRAARPVNTMPPNAAPAGGVA